MKYRIAGLTSIILIIGVICNISAQAQKRCGCCYDSAKAKRVDIVGEKLKQKPYTAMVKLFINSNRFRGTGSFIANNVLLTAKHNLFHGKRHKKLFLHVNSSLGSALVILRKKDYRIFYKGDTEMEDDIALIKITNPEKVMHLDIFNFTVENFENIKSLTNDTIHVTGYPCDKELERPDVKLMGDTLTDKYISPVDSIIFNRDRTIMGFYTCACAGDSGAPLWVIINDNIYVIGVYRGLSNSIDSKKITSIAVVLNQQKVDWVNSVLKE